MGSKHNQRGWWNNSCYVDVKLKESTCILLITRYVAVRKALGQCLNGIWTLNKRWRQFQLYVMFSCSTSILLSVWGQETWWSMLLLRSSRWNLWLIYSPPLSILIFLIFTLRKFSIWSLNVTNIGKTFGFTMQGKQSYTFTKVINENYIVLEVIKRKDRSMALDIAVRRKWQFAALVNATIFTIWGETNLVQEKPYQVFEK